MSEAVLVFTDSELSLLREKNRELTDIEFDAFLVACRRYQLNPLANQIYARLQKATPKNPRSVTYAAQIDGYRLIANRTGQHAGTDAPVYDREDGDRPGKATVTVYKLVEGVRCPYAAPARWCEYCATGNGDFMWRKMPYLMLGKCAEALALRKAFPAELSGLYTVEEMDQADNPDPDANPYRDQQRERAAAAGKSEPASEPPKRTVKGDIDATTTAAELATLLTKLVGMYPVKDHGERWLRIGADAKARLEASGWPDAHKAVVNAVLDGVRNILRAPAEPATTPAAPAGAAQQTAAPPAAPPLERVTGWIDQQETPGDLVKAVESIQENERFAGLRSNAALMGDVITHAARHLRMKVEIGDWPDDTIGAVRDLLEKLDLDYQGKQAFGGQGAT